MRMSVALNFAVEKVVESSLCDILLQGTSEHKPAKNLCKLGIYEMWGVSTAAKNLRLPANT